VKGYTILGIILEYVTTYFFLIKNGITTLA
jgi:hypothetical protein